MVNSDKELVVMASKKPWHAKDSDVYHDNTKCTEGNNIERRNLRGGTGGNRKCDHCKRLGR